MPDLLPASVRLQPVPAQPPYSCVLFPVSGYPAQSTESQSALQWIERLTAGLGDARQSCFLQGAHLAKGDANRKLSRNARFWRPMRGIGVPARRPNLRQISLADIDAMDLRNPRRMLDDFDEPGAYLLRGVAGEPPRATMLGHGCWLEAWSPAAAEPFAETARKRLVPFIEEQAYREFPVYAPYLDAGWVGKATAEDLQHWMCGAALYIRESPPEKGMLAVAAFDLAPMLTRLGMRPDPATREWRVVGA